MELGEDDDVWRKSKERGAKIEACPSCGSLRVIILIYLRNSLVAAAAVVMVMIGGLLPGRRRRPNQEAEAS